MRTIPVPAGAQHKAGASRGVWIAACVALVLIVAGVGVGVGLGLPSKKNSSSKSSSGNPSGTPSVISNGTATPATPSSGPNGTTLTPSGRSSNTSTPSVSPTTNITGLDALNVTELPLAALDQFVTDLNDTAVALNDPDWIALVELIEDNRHMFLLYLRARKLNDVIAFLEATREDADGLTSEDAIRARQAFRSSVNFLDFQRWLRGSDRNVPKLTSSQLAALQAYEPYIDATIIAAYGNDSSATSDGPDLRDPVVQLGQFSGRLTAAGLDFTNLLNPAFYTATEKSGTGGRKLKAAALLPPLGFSWFTPSRIGLVFHILQFRNDTNLFPGNSSRVSGYVTNLVDVTNRFYKLSGVNIQFYIKEVRMDGTMYPYLVSDTLSEWQACARTRQECLCYLAIDNNYEPDTFVNIWVSGFLVLMDEAVLAYSSSLPPVLDTCANALSTSTPNSGVQDDIKDPTSLAYNNVTTPPAQHIWMAYDNLILQSIFNRSLYDDGGATLAHELGHFLGLMHTHDSGCIATDFVADTPPNLLIDSQPWAYKALAPWCRSLRAGRPVNNSALTVFDSCTKDDKYIDNVFNLMSYSPSPCSLLFTPGQVARMQRIATVYRSKMLQTT